MMSDWSYLWVGLNAIAITCLTTPIVNRLATQWGYVDPPSARKVHATPMVRLGGVAIFASTLLALLSYGYLGGIHQLSDQGLSTLVTLGLGSSGFFLIGLADDIFNLPALSRLGGQFAIATLVWSTGIRIDDCLFPGLDPIHLGWLSLPITILWLTGVVNAINWIDGLDGLAAGVASTATLIIIIMSLAAHQPVPALISTALLGSLCGFLRYNFNPAQIFMGDSGSYFIGFTLASLCIVGPLKLESPIASGLPLMILAVPLIDMVSVILMRLLRGASPLVADKTHLHHRLLKLGISHKCTVLIIYTLSLAVGGLSLGIVGLSEGFLISICAVLLLTLLLWQASQLIAIPSQKAVIRRTAA